MTISFSVRRVARWSSVPLVAGLIIGFGAAMASGQAAGPPATPPPATAPATAGATARPGGATPSSAGAQGAADGANDDAEANRDFPPGPGRATVVRVCTRCHDLGEVEKNQDEYAWAATLNLMIEDGAQGTNADFNAIFDYLTTYFGTNPPPVSPLTQDRTAPSAAAVPAAGEGGTASAPSPQANPRAASGTGK